MLVQRDLLERLISDRYVEAPDEKAVGVDPQRQSISTDLWSTSAKRLPLHVKDLEGKRVRAPVRLSKEQRDRYGRTLACVFLLSGTLLNAEISSRAMASRTPELPLACMEEFRRLERHTRASATIAIARFSH